MGMVWCIWERMKYISVSATRCRADSEEVWIFDHDMWRVTRAAVPVVLHRTFRIFIAIDLCRSAPRGLMAKYSLAGAVRLI
jgi:hypothetical protein